LGSWFRGEDTDSQSLSKAIQFIEQLSQGGFPAGIDETLREFSSPPAASDALCESFKTVSEGSIGWEKLRQILGQFGDLDVNWLNLAETIDSDPGCTERLAAIRDATDDLSRWCAFSRAYAVCKRNGLGPFLNLAMDGKIPGDQIARCYQRTVRENAISQFVESHSALREFSRQKHEEIRKSFQKTDRRIIELNRKLIAYNIAQRQPPAGSAKGRISEYREMGLIRHEIQKQQRFCRIRDLLARAGQSVQVLKPCFMMSPLSISQYLPPDGIRFDLVIMDEASQIKPEDALGTVLRATQLVVVGDPKQMPPTSFFDRHEEETSEEEATQMDNTESILEVAMKTFQPVRRLRWHYRSQHESLIQFSNDRFYDNDLVVFPSPTMEQGRLGVYVQYIDNGFFKASVNMVEASIVAKAVIDHAINHPNESLGVGAFNQSQARLISDLMEKLCEHDIVARQAIEAMNQSEEPLFIKNLENLQGDERDVILISFTYGKDLESGRVLNRFGPMNSAVGWRRFNVLITRARRRLQVFSSMRPSDIHSGPDKSRGVNSMRDFLTFCETGRVPTRIEITDRPPDSPFEISVGKVITDMGLCIRPQVGVAGFFIDIGVLKPDSDGAFLLGVECDGASYHSSKSARDRDRLRQEIIEARGWNIHRIWSTDWFHNQKYEEDRLRTTIQRLGGQSRFG
jgi:hypothetical protein